MERLEETRNRRTERVRTRKGDIIMLVLKKKKG